MALTEAELADAAQCIAATAFDPAKWNEALVWLRRAGDGDFAQVIGVHPQHGFQFHFAPEISDSQIKDFETRGGGDPRINPRARIFNTPKYALQCDASLATEEELKRSPFLHEVAYHYDSMDLCAANISHVNGTNVCAAVSRNARQVSRANHEAREFSLLLPHIFTAIRLRAALEGQAAGLVTGALDTMELAAFLLGHDTGIVAMTGPAEALLRDGQLVQMRDRRLATTRADIDKNLQAAIALACAKQVATLRTRQTRLALMDGGSDFCVANIAPLPASAFDLRSGAVAMVTIASSTDRSPALDLMRELFGLTQAEADVAALLSNGTPVEAIARQRRASIQTVRSQIKAILAKTGARSQVHLVAILAGMSQA